MSSDRPNPYAVVHKGIRALMLRLVEEAGKTDYAEAPTVAVLRVEAENVFRVLESHAEHEDRFVAPLIRAADPSLARSLDAEHGEQPRKLADLRAALDGVLSAPPSEARGRGHAFTVAVSRFVGESMAHMADEEERAMPALWSALDDASIAEVHKALVESIPPAERLRAAAWMLPAMNAEERLQLLSELRSTAPAGALEAILSVARRVLDPAAWTRLEAALSATAA
jgi:Hemerythrin HHE cation binding domain